MSNSINPGLLKTIVLIARRQNGAHHRKSSFKTFSRSMTPETPARARPLHAPGRRRMRQRNTAWILGIACGVIAVVELFIILAHI